MAIFKHKIIFVILALNIVFHLMRFDGYSSYAETRESAVVQVISKLSSDSSPHRIRTGDTITFVFSSGKTTHGTGFFVSDEFVVTNRHVVEGYDEYHIVIQVGNKMISKNAAVTYIDAAADLAILRVASYKSPSFLEFDAPSRDMEVSMLSFADSEKDEGVKKSGHLLGGVSNADSSHIYVHTVKTTTGDSGSPIINSHGKVVGLHYARGTLTTGEKVGLIVKGNVVQRLVENVISCD